MDLATAVLANGYYSVSQEEVKYLDNSLICVDGEGRIEAVVEASEESYSGLLRQCESEGKLKRLSENQILIPGFVDLHIHAPQWPQTGFALDQPLAVWLNTYTFPLEAKFRDLQYAGAVYRDVVSATLGNGTTTAMYFGTVDVAPSVLLAESCGELGQRAYVGKVAMDKEDATPEYYRDPSPQESVAQTEAFIRQVQAIQARYPQAIVPVVTPRFIPTCSDEALLGLGALANRHHLPVQSHVSESDWEHGHVLARMGVNDTMALDRFGLLTPRTVLAHGNFVEEADMQILAKRQSSIAHCPLSNIYFANAVLPVATLLRAGVNVGLATDISAGYSPSMYNALRSAVMVSRALSDGTDPRVAQGKRGANHDSITLNTAFYMATVAGGEALGLPVGKFERGYIFDAQVIDMTRNMPRFTEAKSPLDVLHRALLIAQTENVAEVWVQGRRVVARS